MAAVNAIARAERIKTMFGARMQGASHGDRVNHAHHVDNITAAAHQFMIEETKIELSIMCDERAIAQEIQQRLDTLRKKRFVAKEIVRKPVNRFRCRRHGALGVIISVEGLRSEEHTSELQSLMRISYAVF